MKSAHRRTIHKRPPFLREGETAFAMPRQWIEKNAEQAVAVDLVTHRRLFGEVYRGLVPEFFWKMPRDSGVFIQLFVPTRNICPGAERPGDIDMLVIPYEGNELILDQTLAVEIKVLRARFDRQGKSPNEYGLSQAEGLLNLGFPYVAVAHLIVSDSSPKEAWREMMSATVLDDEGNLGDIHPTFVDCLPMDLMARAFGRLQRASSNQSIGLVTAHVRHAHSSVRLKRPAVWSAEHHPCGPNPSMSASLLADIGNYFEARPNWWFDTPSFAPPSSGAEVGTSRS